MDGRVFLSLALSCLATQVAAQDPCEAAHHTVRKDEWKRSTGHQKQSGDIAICDRYIDEGWYRFISPAGNDMPTSCPNVNTCGTTWPIWLKGTLPATNAQVNVDACLVNIFSLPDPCCSKTYSIQVKNCNDEFNVYKLVGTDGCSQAYCIGTEVPCPNNQSSTTGFTPGCTGNFPRITIKPTLTWSIGTFESSGFNLKEVQFSCQPDLSEIPADEREDLHFEVNWYMDDDIVHTEDDVAFVNLPAILHESDWPDRKLGINIACEVRPFFHQNGVKGTKLKSNGFYAGIQVVTPTPLRVSEAKNEPTELKFKTTLPVLCTPIPGIISCDGEALQVEVMIPNVPGRTGTCKGVPVSTTTQLVQELDSMPCGAVIPTITDADDWDPDTTYTIQVKAVLDGKYDGDHIAAIKLGTGSFPLHKIWSNYLHPDILVNVIDEDAKLAGKQCTSNNDPHMRTFSGTIYECFLTGEFILYKHKTLPIQVNTFFKKCNTIATCNCGVAVKSGGDVFVIDYCQNQNNIYIKGNHQSRLRMGMIGCDEETMKIERSNNGRTYKVHLPTGGRVDIALHHHLMNVAVFAGTLDFANTEGLCGDFTGSTNNDLMGRDGKLYGHQKYPNTFSNTWKITQASESLYNGDGSTTYARHPYCTCDNTGDEFDPESELTCSYNKQVSDCIATIDDITRQQFQGCRRRRDESSGGSDYILEERTFVEDSPPNATATWINGWTEALARDHCTNELLGGPIGDAVAMISNLDPEPYIEWCIQDIKISGGLLWTAATVEAFLTTVDNELGKNISLWTFDNATGLVILPEVIAKGLCRNQCSGNGVCNNVTGSCLCHDGYYGADCSLNKNANLTCFDLPNNGLCDERARPCRKTPVYCSHFILELTIKCRFISYKVAASGVIYASQEIETEAEFMHPQEVMCPMPAQHSRKKRSVSSGSSEVVLAEGYLVSVSNNGLNFSGPQYILVYDSKCVECNTSSNCTLKNGTCSIDGVCFVEDEVNPSNPCQSCRPSYNTSGWYTQEDSCAIDGVCYMNGLPSTEATCEVCDASMNSNQWTLQNDKCKINGACYDACASSPVNASLICHPATNPSRWTAPEDAASCDSSSETSGIVSTSSIQESSPVPSFSTTTALSSSSSDMGADQTSTPISVQTSPLETTSTAFSTSTGYPSASHNAVTSASLSSSDNEVYASQTQASMTTLTEYVSTVETEHNQLPSNTRQRTLTATMVTSMAEFSTSIVHGTLTQSASSVSAEHAFTLTSTKEASSYSVQNTPTTTSKSSVEPSASSLAKDMSATTSLYESSTTKLSGTVSSDADTTEASTSSASVLPQNETQSALTHPRSLSSSIAEALPIHSLVDNHAPTTSLSPLSTVLSTPSPMSSSSALPTPTSTPSSTTPSTPLSTTSSKPPSTPGLSTLSSTQSGLGNQNSRKTNQTNQNDKQNGGHLDTWLIAVFVSITVVCICVIVGTYLFISKKKKAERYTTSREDTNYFTSSSSVRCESDMRAKSALSVNSSSFGLQFGSSFDQNNSPQGSHKFDIFQATSENTFGSRPMSAGSHHSAWEATGNEENSDVGRSHADFEELVEEFHPPTDPVTTALPPLSPQFPGVAGNHHLWHS